MDIAESDIFYHAAAAQRTLHADTHIGSHESTVLHQNILYSAGHLTADDETAMAFVHQTVMDVNIAAGPLNLAGNGILPDFMQMASSPVSKHCDEYAH